MQEYFRYLWIAFLFALMLNSCSGQHKRENLDYPEDITKIKEVQFLRPDEESHGKFATVRDLTHDQIVELLSALENAKPIGPTKFLTDYYITFITNDNLTVRLQANGNIVKGYKSDYAYRVEGLMEF